MRVAALAAPAAARSPPSRSSSSRADAASGAPPAVAVMFPRARLLAGPPRTRRASRPRARRRVATRARAGGDLYELLGVPRTATKKEIKAAYKKAALKYHPDVNKAPDANERFNEVKAAYQTLYDPEERRKYDMMSGGGFGGFGGFGSDPFGGSGRSSYASSSSSSSGRRPPPKREEEAFYGFAEFFDDVGKEFAAYESSRAKKRDGSKPRSLWEELEGIGMEFVEFLEEVVPQLDEDFEFEYEETTTKNGETTTKKTSASGTRTSSTRTASTQTDGTGFGSGSARRSTGTPPKRESVDEMLEKLKREMGM